MNEVINLRISKSISADELSTIKLASADDLLKLDEKRVRMVNIDKAITLGHSSDFHTTIIIETNMGKVQLKSRIMSVTNDSILIKEGFAIPLACIYAVDMVK
jgi:hypothetical protein